MFTLDELAAYLPVGRADLEEVRALLLHDLAVGEFERVLATVPDPMPTHMRAVALEVVARAYRNPEGFVQESVDDWSGRREAAAAGVYLTSGEEARLRGTSSTSSVRLVAYPEATSSTLPTP